MVAARQEIICKASELFDIGVYWVCYDYKNERNLLLTGFMIRKALKVHMLNFKTLENIYST
jgi:hypothetical protein